MAQKGTITDCSLDFWNDLANLKHHEYTSDFEGLFRIGESGTLVYTKYTIAELNNFLNKWRMYFMEEDILVGSLKFDLSGVEDQCTLRSNEQAIQRVYVLAFELYRKSCHITQRRPNNKYGNVIIVTIATNQPPRK